MTYKYSYRLKKSIIAISLSTYLSLCCCVQKGLPIINGTQWEYQVAEQFKDYLLFDKEICGYNKEEDKFNYCFKKGQYVEYSSELGYPFSGTYIIKNDTIILTRIDLISELPGTKQKEVKSISKMVLTSDGLATIYYKFKTGTGWNEKWIKSPEVIFKRIE